MSVETLQTSSATYSTRCIGLGVVIGTIVSSVFFWRKGLSQARSGPRNALHDIDEELARRGIAARPGKLTRKFGRNGPAHVIRIVLTGGPCAGKSSALHHLRREATHKGFDVLTAPEIATVVLNSGYQFPAHDDPKFEESQFGFQLAIARLQLSTERNLLRLAQITGRPTIVVFDRGVLDGKTYVTEPEWARILAELRDSQGREVDNQYLLDRYDGVVHLVTAADGAEDFYKSGHTVDDSGHAVVRRENAEEARALDRKLQACFHGHPRHVVVRNDDGGFQQKVDNTVQAVLDIALSVHPQE